MPIGQHLTDLRTIVSDGLAFISMAFNQDNSGNYVHSEKDRLFMSEAAFLKIFIGWEEFIEHAFLTYLLGEISLRGQHVARFATPLSLDHAHKMLVGTQKYVDWANPEIVRKLSTLYFHDGHPFNDVLSAIQVDLFDLRTIRNSAAHLSSTTSQQLDALATRKLKRPCSRIRPSDLLFSTDPNSSTGHTILNSYLLVLDAAAERIANA